MGRAPGSPDRWRIVRGGYAGEPSRWDVATYRVSTPIIPYSPPPTVHTTLEPRERVSPPPQRASAVSRAAPPESYTRNPRNSPVTPPPSSQPSCMRRSAHAAPHCALSALDMRLRDVRRRRRRQHTGGVRGDPGHVGAGAEHLRDEPPTWQVRRQPRAVRRLAHGVRRRAPHGRRV